MRKTRLVVIAMAATALLAATAPAAAADPLPRFDFADCPALPPDADPAQWRCEELVSTGTVTIGRLPALRLTGLKTTFAERHLGNRYAQVFGALRADPVRVPGFPFHTRIRLEYAGFSDFLSVGDRMGEQHLKIAVQSPLLPRTCTIGSNTDPIKFRPIRTEGPTVISENPMVLRFAMADNEFSVPKAYGCGPWTRLVERWFGLPATGGTNQLNLTTYVGLRPF